MIRHFICVLFICVMPGLCPSICRGQTLSIAAAASLKDSVESIGPKFEAANGVKSAFTYGSSGQLMTQINNGAPIDLFLSAAKKQVDDLAKSGKGDASTAALFARNELVLIAPPKGDWAPAGFDDLANPKLHRLAVGEPRTVPAGEYAAQTLDHLKLTDSLKGRLVFGQNVRQVLQYVEDGDVDAGVVYLTDAKQAGDKVKLIATADAAWHQPIEYWGIVVAGSEHKADAQKFLDYLKSDPAQKVLQAAGFTPPTATTQPTSAPSGAPSGANSSQ